MVGSGHVVANGANSGCKQDNLQNRKMRPGGSVMLWRTRPREEAEELRSVVKMRQDNPKVKP